MVDEAATPPQPTSASDLPAESVPTQEPVETNPPAKATAKVVNLADAAASKVASQPSAGASAPDAGAGEATSGGASKPAKKAEKEMDWGKLNHLVENFTLIYPTDTI